mgnify:CR=1 FL=1
MDIDNTSHFILHVSDFHLTDNEEEIKHAQNALDALVKKLSLDKIKVDYLVHTGDVIDSSDLYEITAQQLNLESKYFSNNKNKKLFDECQFRENSENKEKEEFNLKLKELIEKRFNKAKKVFEKFIADLNIPSGNVVICSGNHDVMRPFLISNSAIECKKGENDNWLYTPSKGLKLEENFIPFENFLDDLGVANSKKKHASEKTIMCCNLDNLNFLILNTNWKNPKNQKQGYFCTRCDIVNNEVNKITISHKNLNIILAHKPLYEICEQTRLSYQRYIQTPFMSNLRKFIGGNGIYLCGDKHTRSIVGSQFHDIPHYIGGEPLKMKANNEVEYNLLQVLENKLGMERKIHLKCIMQNDDNSLKWECDIRPQDAVVSKLYELSGDYIVNEAFDIIDFSQKPLSWESICQKTYNWDDVKDEDWYVNLNKLYQSICKYRKSGIEEILLDKIDIFDLVCERLKELMNNKACKNLLNIRGEYNSGKSLFLGVFFIYLLNQYSIGKINFIPAYFNLENEEITAKINTNVSYLDAVKENFEIYMEKIQEIASKENQSICFILDGLDEQDCWSYSTEDSIGRILLNELSKYDNSRYVMSFSQHRLPCFKNTMPARKYNDFSDILYFNPTDIREKGAEDSRFLSFVQSFLKLQSCSNVSFDSSSKKLIPETITDEFVEQVCNIIRHFRRLTITVGFMYENLEYIVEQDNVTLTHEKTSVSEIYSYYIDKQYEICLDKLGYNFVEYAPAMAYLFSFKGYTYEKFKYLRSDSTVQHDHIFKLICKHYDQLYHTFLFIKKHKDAREYLIALHYNRELRYYTEHPDKDIDSNSILNEFICRNIAVIIRKLWTDTNKFSIASEILLKRQDLPACMQSILVYCLFHLHMYAPIRDQFLNQLQEKGETFLKENNCENWIIENGSTTDKLHQFINLSLKHSIEIFRLVNSTNSIQLVSVLISDKTFQEYNRQFQMLYYEDLSIKGEETRHVLSPGHDLIYKGFDFHNCFYYLYVKLKSSHQYPLREFDMFTLWDLIRSRLIVNNSDTYKAVDLETFFYRDNFKERANMVLEHTLNIFNKYVDSSQKVPDNITSSVYIYFSDVKDTLKEIISIYNEVPKKNKNMKGGSHEDKQSKIKHLLENFDENFLKS